MPAIAITVAEVRDVIKTSSSDAMIQMFIDAVEEKLGECYAPLSSSLQKILKTHLVAYFIETSTGVSEISGTRAPNGASVSYAKNMKESLGGSPYGRIVLNLDSSGCWANMINMTVGVFSVGGAG